MVFNLGIDEAGRGAWAGPLVAACVGLSSEKVIDGLRDSKTLTAQKREELFDEICASADYVGVGWVSAKEIDSQGMTESVRLAMQRSMDFFAKEREYSRLVIDGNYNFLKNAARSEAVVRADSSHDEVMAASIVAKVSRDRYMTRLAKNMPAYSYELHKGYGTAVHKSSLLEAGVSVEHRTSFKPIREILDESARS